MKKKITWRLSLIIIATMLLTLAVNFIIQIDEARDAMVRASRIKINQIHEIILKNEEEIERLTESAKESYVIQAQAAAYILDNHPEIIHDLQEMRKVASLLQIDELHVFDKTGRIYAGTHPEYYDFTFDTGEQIGFFKPMLTDKSLVLTQDITPNTAEGRSMQYTAVWQESGDNIIQIGMAPERLMEAIEKNELPYIFSMVTAEEGTSLLVIEKESGMIVGSTQKNFEGKTLERAGIVPLEKFQTGKGMKFEVRGEGQYGYFEDHNHSGHYIGVLQENSVLYDRIVRNMSLLCLFLICITVIMFLSIMKCIDLYVLRGIDELIQETTEIIDGDLENKVSVTTTPEFEKLSDYINHMVSTVLSTTDKLSMIFDMTAVQIGVYEYSDKMKQVRATKKISSLFLLSSRDMDKILEDKEQFQKIVDDICTKPVPEHEDTYQPFEDLEYYLQIQKFSHEGEVLGIITDVTEEILRWRQVRYDADYDILTGLLNRRGFYMQLDKVFEDSENIGNAVVMVMDMNKLKFINDTYGHASGDSAIKAAGELLAHCPAINKAVARLGGDEFAMLIYGEKREALQAYIDDIQSIMMNSTVQLFDDTEIPIRFSAGYIYWPEYNVNSSKLLNYADKAMYRSKKEGKAEFKLYDPDLD